MLAEAFVICWNEIETIQFTIDYYKSFCDRITFYDNHSDDGTREVIESNGCILKTFGQKGVLNDKDYITIKNSCWKDSKAKWVIVVDSDEIVYHSSIKRVLEESSGTIFHTQGYNMYSKEMPKESFLDLNLGVPNQDYSKLCVFSPKITRINYVYGCHEANPVGNIRFCDTHLKLLHYRNIGGPERLVNRHEEYRKRLSDFNKKWKLGVHYEESDEDRVKYWNRKYAESYPLDIERVVLPSE